MTVDNYFFNHLWKWNKAITGNLGTRLIYQIWIFFQYLDNTSTQTISLLNCSQNHIVVSCLAVI